MWGEQGEMGGWFPLDKRQTPSSASPFFDQPPPPAYFTPHPHSQHVRLFWWVRYSGSPPPTPPIHLSGRFWPDSLSWLTLKKLPQKSLCQPQLTASHHALFPSCSSYSLDSKHEWHSATFFCSPIRSRHGKLSHRSQFSPHRPVRVHTTKASCCLHNWQAGEESKTLPPPPILSSNPLLLTVLFWHVKEEAN